MTYFVFGCDSVHSVTPHDVFGLQILERCLLEEVAAGAGVEKEEQTQAFRCIKQQTSSRRGCLSIYLSVARASDAFRSLGQDY